MTPPDELIAKLLKSWHFLYKRGFIEGFGHLSARLPDSELFLLARHSLGPRATADDFLVVDMKGRKVSGAGDLPAEYPIHLEILKARVRLNQIMSLHTGQTLETIQHDTERDRFLTSEEAREYGLIDAVLNKRSKIQDARAKAE